MVRDYVKLREAILDTYATGEHWKADTPDIQAQVSMAPAATDFAIAGLKVLEVLEENSDMSDTVFGLAGSVSSVILNWAKQMHDPEEAAVAIGGLVLGLLKASRDGQVHRVHLQMPSKSN